MFFSVIVICVSSGMCLEGMGMDEIALMSKGACITPNIDKVIYIIWPLMYSEKASKLPVFFVNLQKSDLKCDMF